MVAGHLQVKKNNYYMVLNLKDENGKRKSKWLPTGIPVGGKKNLKAAEDLLAQTRIDFKLEVTKFSEEISENRITSQELFSDFMLKWLDRIKNSVEEDTYSGYHSNVTRAIVPYFYQTGVTLGKLTALDIEDFYTFCFNKLKLKGSTIRHYHANMHKALKYAVRHMIIPVSPMERVERPKAQNYIGSFYTADEIEQLFAAIKGDPLEFAVLTAAFYGLRRSEILGLRWQSIDFVGNTMTINHTVVPVHGENGLTTVCKDRTKNLSSYRTLPLVPQYKVILLKIKAMQEANRKLCGNSYKDSDYICVNQMGELMKPNYVSTHFTLLLKKNNLRAIRFHDLRHTCASLLLKNGVSMREIQEWLGHSDFNTTARFYAHLETNSKAVSAEKMMEVLALPPTITEPQ